VLLDDKAGFDPDVDWKIVVDQVKEERKKFHLE
jgi:hypothetical protein